MTTDPRVEALAQQVHAQLHVRTGLGTGVALALATLLPLAAYFWEMYTWRSNPRHIFVAGWMYVVGLLNALAGAGVLTWVVYRALDTARVVGLVGGTRRGGDTFIDADGVHDSAEHLYSAYVSTSVYLASLLMFAAGALVSWYFLFACGRALVDRLRNR